MATKKTTTAAKIRGSFADIVARIEPDNFRQMLTLSGLTLGEQRDLLDEFLKLRG